MNKERGTLSAVQELMSLCGDRATQFSNPAPSHCCSEAATQVGQEDRGASKVLCLSAAVRKSGQA